MRLRKRPDSSTSFRPRRPWFRRRRFFLPAGLILALAVVAAVVTPSVMAAVRHGSQAREQLTAAQAALEDQDFTAAITAADKATDELSSARDASHRLAAFRPIPWIGTQVKAVDVILDVGINLTEAMGDGIVAVQQILGPLQEGQGNISLATLTPADKRQILKRLSESEPQLTSVKDNIGRAVNRFADVPDSGLMPQLADVVTQLREQLPFLQDTVSQLIPATKIIPAIAGFPDAKTYLFLLENNTELRPTGGFIGTYGILKVNSGEISSFVTNDVYNLDTPAKDRLHVTPPKALTMYNDTTQWFFRDSNWSPDFPTSAEKALEFYRLEGGAQKNFDGVIAVTPTFISSLLKISGDITVDKITFTPDNLIDRLQPLASRKELIGEMSTVLMDRILALPQRRWQELITAMTTALEERHMLLYAREAGLQQQIVDQHWGGALVPYNVDGLAVIDANLASLKTDSVMDRAVDYNLDITSDAATATVKITYTNKGKFTTTTTRYRTYTRVYVPLGSKLVSSSGALRNDKLRGARPGTVDVTEELGRTVFGAFISIEPGEVGTLSFTYELPGQVLTAVRNGSYELFVQKQAGTRAHGLTATLRFPTDVERVTGVDGIEIKEQDIVSLTHDLRRDRHLIVTL